MEMCHNEEEKTFDTDRGHLLCSLRFSILVLSRSSVGRVCCGGVLEHSKYVGRGVVTRRVVPLVVGLMKPLL